MCIISERYCATSLGWVKMSIGFPLSLLYYLTNEEISGYFTPNTAWHSGGHRVLDRPDKQLHHDRARAEQRTRFAPGSTRAGSRAATTGPERQQADPRP